MEEITYTKAQYDELLEKYKTEVEKRAVAEANFNGLYTMAVQAGLIRSEAQKEVKHDCDCEECKHDDNE